MTLTTFLIILLFVHTVAETQTEWMSLNKSKNVVALTAHACLYFFIFNVGTLFLPLMGFTTPERWAKFVVVNCLAHFWIDFATSKLNRYLHGKSQFWFWRSILFDQFVHLALMVYTLQYL